MTQTVAAPYRVAVITRTKDRPVLLRRAIESVLKQTCPDWIHVIVNDGGHPVLVDLLVAEYAERYRERVKVLHHPQSLGMQNASNAAIRATQSEFVTIHDDDDSWEPAFLEAGLARLDKLGADNPVQGVATHTTWVFEEMGPDGNMVELRRQDFPATETIKLADVAGENRFPPIAFLYRRQVHEAVGYFNEEFSVLGDWDFNLRFLCRYDIDVVPERLACWHWRQQGGGTAYGNSSTTGVAIHKAMEAKLFNHYLRRDMETGRLGLGHLMNLSRQVVGVTRQMEALNALLQPIGIRLSNVLQPLAILCSPARLWEAGKGLGIMAVRAWRRLIVKGPNGKGTKKISAELAAAISALAPGDILSLDVFDTALFRVVRHPTDLFAFIEPEVRALLERSDFPFGQARVAAERAARRWHVGEACEDVTLDQIYEVLAEAAGIPPDLINRVRDLEINAEQRLCYANPVVQAAVRSAQQKGVRVVFISDMYLPADTIRQLLVHNGYDAPEVYSSCTSGKTKHSGTLFKELLENVCGSAERVFHVGDHPESDHRRPREMGIRTLHVERKDYGPLPLADQPPAVAKAGQGDALSSLCTGLVRRRAMTAGFRDEIWERLGYEVAGPLAYAFARWMAQQARKHDIHRLFFLSRDGYLLEKVFRACVDRWGLDIQPAYMYSSRRLLNMARIERLDEAAYHFLLTADPFLRVRDFLERIGLSAEGLASEVARAGFAGLEEVVTTRGGVFRAPGLREGMRRVLAGQETQILGIAEAERRSLQAYFADIGFVPGPVAIADLGWQASSVRSLQDLLRLQQPDFRLRGYYFGTWASAASAVEVGCHLDSFFFHLGLPESRAALLRECVELVEHLFTAPHATVVGLEHSEGRWNPICGGWETTAEQRDGLARVSRSAMAFVGDMLEYEASLSPHAAPITYLESVLERVLRHPTLAEARLIGALPHRDSFGGEAPWRYLAKVPSTFRPGALREACDRSYWRKGFLVQLGPVRRALVAKPSKTRRASPWNAGKTIICNTHA